jgi:restriction endonuclease S subunit
MMKTKETSTKFGLKQKTIDLINSVFAKYPQIEKVILYGSRAKGNFKTGSDIDLTMVGDDLTTQIQMDVFDELDELMLPYKMDLSIFAKLNNENLREHIERVGVVFYNGELLMVNGKLNSTSDLKGESAKTLLNKLKQEKERLIKEKLLINSKEVVFKDNDKMPFTIPSHWLWVRLNEVSIIQEGPGIRKHQYQKQGIQFLTVTNILDGEVDLTKSKKFISQNEYKSKYKHFTINKNDIVSSCSGATWGKTAIFDTDETLILNTSTLRLRFFGDLGDNKYLYYLTKADFFKNQIKIQLSGQQPNFGYSHYSVIAIPLPPLPEQQRIVATIR